MYVYYSASSFHLFAHKYTDTDTDTDINEKFGSSAAQQSLSLHIGWVSRFFGWKFFFIFYKMPILTDADLNHRN